MGGVTRDARERGWGGTTLRVALVVVSAVRVGDDAARPAGDDAEHRA
ncbi:hypothetical protein [Roseomonas sp. WA12]